MSTATFVIPKTTKLRPLYDRVLVKVVEPKEVMKNGLYVPDVAVEKPLEGEVIAVGKGRLENGVRVPLDVEEGDRVVFGRYSGSQVELLGQKLLLLQEEELQGVYFEE
jgi:chaperonin GroES